MLKNNLPPYTWRSVWTDKLSFDGQAEYHFRFVQTIRGDFEIDYLPSSTFSIDKDYEIFHVMENQIGGLSLSISNPELITSLAHAKEQAQNWAKGIELIRKHRENLSNHIKNV